MSILAMNWAWAQELYPTEKLVLMALSDAADETGLCWPSVARLAKKCCVSERTIQRTLASFSRRGLLIVEHRYHKYEMRQLSNLYRLQMSRCDKTSPPKLENIVEGVAESGVSVSWSAQVSDTSDTQTTIEPSTESPPQLRSTVDQSSNCGQESQINQNALIFPRELRQEEVSAITSLLREVPFLASQEILDELAGVLRTPQKIRTSPSQYANGLLNRYRAGNFVLLAGVKIRAERKASDVLAIQQLSATSTPEYGKQKISELVGFLKLRK